MSSKMPDIKINKQKPVTFYVPIMNYLRMKSEKITFTVPQKYLKIT
jgi:hypothetical protein